MNLLLATVALLACWGAFALTWLVSAIYYESRAPQERTRRKFGPGSPRSSPACAC